MVGKCANPACESSFRYLHKGKLLVIEAQFQTSNPAFPDQRRPIYVWLCETCSRTMTVAKTGGRVHVRGTEDA